MSLVVLDAARALMALGGAGANFALDRNKSVSEEYSVASGASLAGDLLTAAASLHRTVTRPAVPQFNNGVRVDAGPDVILLTLNLVEVVELMTGFGPPYEGDDFKTGSSMFIRASEQLNSALPDDRWQGSAAQAYADQDAALQTLAQQVAALDQQLADIIKSEADIVTHIRLSLGLLKIFLCAAYRFELALLAVPGGAAAAYSFATGAAATGTVATLGLLGTLSGFQIENASKVDGLTTQYDALRTGAGVTGTTFTQTEGPAAVESTASGLPAFGSAVSEMSGMPTIATLARSAPEAVSPEQNSLLADPSGAPPAWWGPTGNTPAPVFPIPGFASQTQYGGQAANPLPPIGIANQPPRQTLNPVGRQGQKEPGRAAEDDSTETGGAGPADGTQGAGRTPIEVTASHLNGRRERF
ncbi:EspA/EspE family type VII secretion system effector [Mycobacterium sp. Aquia_213]|uniref:EspA/EspE family type VII secretion system effector n=1 Tax=Mycobacterium sp. Aquia_213 TaxID=2991728 RepID=UPI002271494A|nr:EspA/EspE family type VII secretion system effector [Mycobacterium sp. Aquia_213]WAC93368.1 EspA/EspE family type VII secretion system effector [Mycobacterium sp. Aquia_213]